MRSLLLMIAAVTFGSSSTSLRASEESFLPWASIRLTLAANEKTGEVTFSAKTDGVKFQEIIVEAFGKKYSVAKESLDNFDGCPLSSLQTSHEPGYEMVGGHTIYFRFTKANSKTSPGDKSVPIIMVQESGLKITVPRSVGVPGPETPK